MILAPAIPRLRLESQALAVRLSTQLVDVRLRKIEVGKAIISPPPPPSANERRL